MTFQSVNPATGEEIKQYNTLDDTQVDAALSRAQDAFHTHKNTSFKQRAEKMHKAADYLDENAERLAELIVSEMGKLYPAAKGEVQKCAKLCRYYADHAESLLADQKIEGTDAKECFVRYLPIGPVLAVMPWNFPFWQALRFGVPALMAGNVGLLKHASNVPGCALAIEEVFVHAGFNQGEFQTLLIGSDKVADIIADDRVRAVTLTGSEKAGAAVAAQAGKSLKKSVLELGGSDPFIVMPSADLEKAADMALTGRVQNNGQTCIAAKRYIVHDDIYESFKAMMIERFEAVKVGDPMADNTDVGPLSMPQIRDDLDRQVNKSVKAGATLLCGGGVIEGKGNFYRPALLADIPKDAPAYHEELFGPVGSLFKVSGIEDAVTLANDTRFGLGSAVFTQDQREIDYAVNRIDAGCTFVNSVVASAPNVPFGGVKSSGYGRELAGEGIREFTNIKTISIA